MLTKRTGLILILLCAALLPGRTGAQMTAPKAVPAVNPASAVAAVHLPASGGISAPVSGEVSNSADEAAASGSGLALASAPGSVLDSALIPGEATTSVAIPTSASIPGEATKGVSAPVSGEVSDSVLDKKPIPAPGELSVPAVAPQHTRSRPKFDRGIEKKTFVPKGQWIAGGNLSYSEHTNDNYKVLVINHWDGKGYTLKVSPFFGYAFANDVVAGGRFEYGRSLLKIDNVGLDLGSLIEDMDLSLKDIYSVNHDFTVTGFLRTYINLGDSKRFALYNDVRLSFGYGQGKIVNGKGDELTGTYQTTMDVGVGLTPGLVAFINDFVAVEVNVGVLGFNVKWVDQLTDQVEHGYRRTSSANFKINLFSIGLGIAFYL